MPEGARRGSTKKGGKAAPRPASVSSLGGIGSTMASDPILGSCTSVNTVCSDSDRPVSLSSSASSASLQDSQSTFGSSSGLGGCPASYLHQNGSDISLDLTPLALLDGPGEAQGGPKHCGWTMNPSRSKERRAKLSHLDRVVLEIVETEQAYVRDLRSIVEDYLGCIIDCGQLPLKPEQVNALFCNIEDIYEFNSELLEDLERDTSACAVAECFVQRSEEFDIYTLYCMNYPNSVSVLRECMETDSLAKFFRERQVTLSHVLPLETYLLKPVQRILKYHLLLQELAKHYDKSSPGYEAVEEASITMTAVAWYINDMKRRQEHATRLKEIQGLLVGWTGPELGVFGELVLEGQFRVPRARKERVFFLLSKVILIAKRRGEAFIYKSHIFCCNLALQENTKDPLSFRISDLSIPKQQHLVQVKNQEEKRLWIHYLKRLIVENHPASIPQKAKQVLLENSFQSSPEASFDSPKKPLPSPQLDESKGCVRGRRQSEPPEYMYSPERARRSCPILLLEKSGSYRRGRRQSEPAKESEGSFQQANMAELKHADSNGELFPAAEPLHPSGSSCTLASSVVEAEPGDSDPEEGEVEFSLPEEPIPTNLSITEEILELLSQRGLDKETGTKGAFLGPGSTEVASPGAQDQLLQNDALEELEEEEEEEEPNLQEDVAFEPTLASSQSNSLQEQPPPKLSHSFTSDSSEGEEQQREEAGSPSPLHVLEDLAAEEVFGKQEDADGDICSEQEATDGECLPAGDADGSCQPVSCPQSSLVGLDKEEERVQMEGGAKRESSLSKDDWLLIEKIKSYYEGAEGLAKAPGQGKKECAPSVPAGVVRESVLRFNSILRQNDAQDGGVGRAKSRKPRPPPSTSSHDHSSRSRSQSCSNQLPSCQEGKSQRATSPEHSKRGRSQSDSTQATDGSELSCSREAHLLPTCCKNSEKGRCPSMDTQSNAIQSNSGQERTHQDSKCGCGLEEEVEPVEPEFKSCAEIRRAWQEKERSLLGTQKKGTKTGSRELCCTAETLLYAEPLCIVEDSDLEDSPAVPNRKPEPEAPCGAAEARPGATVPDGSSSYLPSLDLYENNGDPCLLENSERIISKVHALAKMYSEKISRLKAQRGQEKPRARPWASPRAAGRSLVGVQDGGRPGGSIPHCEPRIYGHVLIHESLQHVIGVQENIPLVAATRGTAVDLHSERPHPLRSPDFLAPLRQALQDPSPHSWCLPSNALPHAGCVEIPTADEARGCPRARSPSLARNPEPGVPADLAKGDSDMGGPPPYPKSTGQATLGTANAVVCAGTSEPVKEKREAEQPFGAPMILPGVSVETVKSSVSLTQQSHSNLNAATFSGPAEELEPTLSDSSTVCAREQDSPQTQELGRSLLGAEARQASQTLLQKREHSPSLKMAECQEGDGQTLGRSKETCETESGTCSQETPHPTVVPEASKATIPLSLPSSGIEEASSLSNFSHLLPPKVGTPIWESPLPRCGDSQAAVESPVSVQEDPPSTPLPKLLPPSPARGCLSSSAAAISRYIAASCISQSLARKNGAPQHEELQASPCRPPASSWALTRPPANPLALLPKGAPKVPGGLGKAEALFPRDMSLSGCAPRCFTPGPLSPSRQRAWSAAAPTLERRTPFCSASEPNSRVQSPSPMKSRVCSPPPSGTQACTFTPLCAHPPGQPPTHIVSPVPQTLHPAPGPTVLPQCGWRPRGNSLPSNGLTESPAANRDQASSWCAMGPTSSKSSPPTGAHLSSHELGTIKWPNVLGLRSKYVGAEHRPSPQQRELEGEGCPQLDPPVTTDVARCAEKGHQRACYSTTVNIQIGGSGRIASFSNAQVSLTHPLLGTPEQPTIRKVNGSALETTQKT